MQTHRNLSTTAIYLALAISMALLATLAIDNFSYGAESLEPTSPPLRLALVGQLTSPDPHEEHTVSSESIFASVCEKLVEFDVDGTIRPGLALSWRQIEPTTLRFSLRQDVRFHDGRPLTAKDVQHSLERAKHHPRGKLRTRLATISDITPVDSYILDISTRRPDPLLLKQLAFIGIMPAGTPYDLDAPTCTGPYRWLELEPRKHVRLRRFADYWGPAPEAQEVVFQMDSDSETMVSQLLGGQTHLGQLTPLLADTVDANDELWIFSRISPGVYYLKLNVQRAQPRLDAFRAAIDFALDREALVEQGFEHYARAANQLVSPSSAGFVERSAAPVRDVARSRTLVNSIELRNPVENSSFICLERDAHLCLMISSQLAEAGISTDLLVVPSKRFHELSEKGLYDIALLKWFNNIHDANDAYANIVHSKDLETGLGIGNNSRLTDATLDAWIEQAMYTVDVEQRQALMRQIADRVAELRATIPLVWEMVLYAAIRDLDWQPRSDHRIAPSEIELPSVRSPRVAMDHAP